MKAVVFDEHGPVENLYVAELPVPEPGPGQVRIKIAWAALNHLDLWTRRGMPGLNLTYPHIGGSDMAGTIDAVGEGVEGQASVPGIGDRVVVNAGVSCGHCVRCRAGEDSECDTYHIIGEHTTGGYAEYAVVPARNVVKVPDGFPLKKACAASLAYQTAYRMLKGRADLRPAERLLVLGAGSGVSSAAIQIGKLLGARVYATTSSAAKAERARTLGADHVIDYTQDEDWHKTMYKLTEKQGVDVVMDHVGEATWQKSLRTLRKGGRLVTCGGTTGPMVTSDVRLLFWRQISILGSTMANHAEYREVMQLVFDGRLDPPIDETFELEAVPDAHRRMEEGDQFGKIMIRVSGEE